MFCPGCGLEERESNQFCRSCGTDTRKVRLALERPDGVTASAISARDEIGRAVAARIRETKSAKELALVTEEVLPQIERFLESPAEKRLRRLRTGTILSTVGLGVSLAFSILGILLREEPFLIVAAIALIPFVIGLGVIVNGLLLSLPKTGMADISAEVHNQSELDVPQPKLVMPERSGLFSSVTENTTTHLSGKQPVIREFD